MFHNSPVRSSLFLAILTTLCPPQVSALDLYGDSSDGQVTIENPSEEYSRVIGWTEGSGKNVLDGGSVLAKDLSAFRIFGAEYHARGSVESITVTNNGASLEDVRQHTNGEDGPELHLGGAHIQGSSYTADITAKLNRLKVAGTLSGIEGTRNTLNIFGAFASSQSSDSSAEIIVQDNNVVLDGVKIQGWQAVGISAGSSSAGAIPIALSGNKIEIVNSDIHATNYVRIEGGYANSSSSPSQKVSGNIVSIRDSTITADSWLVVTGGATYVYGDKNTEITGNQVQLHNAHIDGWVFGGSYNVTSQVNKGNSIKVSGVNSATSIHGFDTLYVELSDVNTESPVLTLSGSLDLTDRNLNISGAEGFTVKGGDTYSLISAPSITGVNEENLTVENTLVAYDAKLSVDTGELSLTTTAPRPTDNSKTLSESLLGTVAFLNQGAEFIADEGLAAIVNSAKLGEISTFGAFHGGSSNYKTGSRVDVDGYTLATGASLKVRPNWIVAGFVEAGWADSDSHVEGAKGEGDHDYYGLGLATRYMVNDAWYIDGSLRVGQASTEFTGLYARDSAKYDSDAFYVTAHAGTGYLFNLTDSVNLDVYGRYLVTYLDGDDVRLHNKYNDKFDMDSTVTHAVRVGGRLTGSFCPYAGWKVGLAYEHVFDGDAESAVNSLNLEVPSLEGDTGVMEVGVTMKPSLNSRWSMDLGAKGYAGDREGVTGSVMVRYAF